MQDLADPLQRNPYIYANNSPVTQLLDLLTEGCLCSIGFLRRSPPMLGLPPLRAWPRLMPGLTSTAAGRLTTGCTAFTRELRRTPRMRWCGGRTYKRSSSKNGAITGGMDLPFINTSAQAGWTSDTTIAYKFSKAGTICGSNDTWMYAAAISTKA